MPIQIKIVIVSCIVWLCASTIANEAKKDPSAPETVYNFFANTAVLCAFGTFGSLIWWIVSLLWTT